MPSPKIPRPNSDPDAAFVYVIASGDYVKIGVSNNPGERLRALRTGMPTKPFIAGQRLLPTRTDAYSLELAMHRTFRRQRTNGEWFRIPARTAVRALTTTDFHREGRDVQAIIAEAFRQGREEPRLL